VASNCLWIETKFFKSWVFLLTNCCSLLPVTYLFIILIACNIIVMNYLFVKLKINNFFLTNDLKGVQINYVYNFLKAKCATFIYRQRVVLKNIIACSMKNNFIPYMVYHVRNKIYKIFYCNCNYAGLIFEYIIFHSTSRGLL
jgi:hypothetical protein